jgi:hypothetical protein
MSFILCWRITLKYIIKKQGLKVWIGFIWLRTGTSGGFSEDKSEILSSFRGRESFE